MSYEKTVEKYEENFNVDSSAKGEKVYEWNESQLATYSIAKLADILTISSTLEGFFEDSFVNEVEEELVKRSSYIEQTSDVLH